VGERNPVEKLARVEKPGKQKSSRWLMMAVVAAGAGVGLWLGADWLWHLFLRMHGIHR